VTYPPIWSRKIIAFRDLLGDSQTVFGRKLSVSAMTVSRWESGQQKPSSRHYIDLGNLAEDSECWYYWELAGLSKKRVSSSLASRHKN
jgi:transcriptional regulator with XRE-family HTH domain